MSAVSCGKIVRAACLTAAVVLVPAAIAAVPASAAVAGQSSAVVLSAVPRSPHPAPRKRAKVVKHPAPRKRARAVKHPAPRKRARVVKHPKRARPAAPRKHLEVLRGVDVSSIQHLGGKSIDWNALARDGIRFAGIKASEGTYYANPYYAADARAARAAGLDVMPYVFANPRDAGGAATASFAIRVSAYRKGSRTLPLAVDLENDPYSSRGRPGNCYGLGRPSMIAWIREFTGKVQQLTGTHPVIYTTAGWWRQCTGDTNQFRRSPLWVAEYGVRQPAVPRPWGNWTFWQYSDGGWLPGAGTTDLDYFRAMISGLRKIGHK